MVGDPNSSPEQRAAGGTGSLVRRGLFVDRDGTLVPDLKYLSDPDRLEVYAGVSDGLRLAREAGFVVLCITNQAGIARGFYTEEDVLRIHRRLNELLGRFGAQIDAFYFCPHSPEDRCDCRKPGTALFERAAAEWSVGLGSSAVIGDRAIDVAAGKRVGALTAVVPSRGHEVEVEREMSERDAFPDIRASSFLAAVVSILAFRPPLESGAAAVRSR